MTIEIKRILFADYSHEVQIGETEYETVEGYSADIVIILTIDELRESKHFVIQVSGNRDEAHGASIPAESLCDCGLIDQDWAHENLDQEEIWNLLEKEHNIENNFGFLSEAGELIN